MQVQFVHRLTIGFWLILGSLGFGQQAVTTTFDWTNPSFWRSQDGRPVAESWEFADGEIRLAKSRDGNAALLSPPMPAHFELAFQWKVTANTNSGLKYRVRQFGDLWLGIEYQMIDEPIPLTEPSKWSTGSLYDLVPPSRNKPHKADGDWNDAKIIVVGNRFEHYLNGVLVTNVVASGPDWDACFVRSKFYGHVGFGEAREGDQIMLTDHGGNAAFRNFRLVAIDAPRDLAETKRESPQLGNGMRNSWVDQTSIVLWTRTTSLSEMKADGLAFQSISKDEQNRLSKSTDAVELLKAQLPRGASLADMNGACPGSPGQVRLTYFPTLDRNRSITTAWSPTAVDNDCTHQWHLTQLSPGTEYAAIVEAKKLGGDELTCVQRGRFQTAPAKDNPADLVFCMTTCHDYSRRDDGANGHKIYPAMEALNPHFVVHAGDIEYYDHEDPWAWTMDLMRFKWARIFSLPNNRKFYKNHSTYFMKDDHDTLKDDCWPGQRYGAVTFEQGLRLFNEEQFPTRSPRYGTYQWGKDLQIWLLEGRDYRSSNRMPDGPDKTILGDVQKAWLMKSLKESTATFKLVFSPTPLVGPDRDNKQDNHSNDTFQFEGDALRKLLGEINNAIVLCGDRHWQYASVESQSKLWEFGCGPGSERHQFGWKAGDVRPIHRFLRVDGGFLSGSVSHTNDEKATLVIRHHKVSGEQVSEFKFPE